jgi:hypothetical protein
MSQMDRSYVVHKAVYRLCPALPILRKGKNSTFGNMNFIFLPMRMVPSNLPLCANDSIR